MRGLRPLEIAGRVEIPAFTVRLILVREGVSRLDHMDQTTREVIRRHERDRPGDLIHNDANKLGSIPAGGGWKVHGSDVSQSRATGQANAAARDKCGTGKVRYAYVHPALDERPRLTYSEVHDHEASGTVLGSWRRAVVFFADHSITVSEVLTDKGPAFRWPH